MFRIIYNFIKYKMLFVILSSANIFGDDYYPIVTTCHGCVKGTIKQTAKCRNFSSFTGIPFAKPPMFERRFMKPVPPEPWQGVLDATKSHNACPQSNSIFGDSSVYGREDCLYLNIYTPFTAKEELASYKNLTAGLKFLPVMIFFHGIAFIYGNANYHTCNPQYLLDKDIVLVVPNYRLGALGFFSTGDEIVPGNNGLKDQNLAIKWVKRNIAYFGGDTERITLFGQSSGAASAHFHMLSTMSKGLIDRVICESGTALSPWALSRNDHTQKNSKTLAHFFGCYSESNTQMIRCLRKVDPYDIVNQQDNLFYVWNMEPIAPFRPVVEPIVKEAFLTEEPQDIIKSDKSAKVPLIIGMNVNEGAFKSSAIFSSSELMTNLKENFLQIIPISLFYDDLVNKNQLDQATEQVKSFYFGNNDIDSPDHGDLIRKQLTNMYTDVFFLLPLHKTALFHLNYTSLPTYLYIFAYRGIVSYTQKFGDANLNYGVCHCDELIYLFSQENHFEGYSATENDRKVSSDLVKMWADFASVEDPTPNNNCARWFSGSLTELQYYIISENSPCMIKEIAKSRIAFWIYWYRKFAPLYSLYCDSL